MNSNRKFVVPKKHVLHDSGKDVKDGKNFILDYDENNRIDKLNLNTFEPSENKEEFKEKKKVLDEEMEELEATEDFVLTKVEDIASKLNHNNYLIEFAAKLIQDLAVHSNELEFDSEGISTGNISFNCVTYTHKAEILKREIKLVEEKSKTNENDKRKDSIDRKYSMFVGDSLCDLAALLEADIGIILGTKEVFFEYSELLGFNLKPLVDVILHIDNLEQEENDGFQENNKKQVLFYANTWTEIGVLLFGHTSIAHSRFL